MAHKHSLQHGGVTAAAATSRRCVLLHNVFAIALGLVNTMPRDNNLYVNSPMYKRDGDQSGDDAEVTMFPSKEAAIKELQTVIAKAYFNGGAISGVLWIKKERSKKPNALGETWQKFRCAYANSTVPCGGELRLVETADGQFYIQFANRPHNEHNGTFRKGVAPQLKAKVLDTPSKLSKRPMDIQSRAATMPGATMDTKERKQLESLLYRQRSKHTSIHLDRGQSLVSFGALCTTLDLMKLEDVRGSTGFNQHKIFLCSLTDSQHYIAEHNEDNTRVVAVLSSENLLLNAFRASQQGWPMNFHIDASHRYDKSDWLFYIPLTVTSLNQQAHVVAYGLVTADDADTNEYILRATKRHVERVVWEKQQDPLVTHV